MAYKSQWHCVLLCQLPGRSELHNSWSSWKSTSWSFTRHDLCVQMSGSCVLLCFFKRSQPPTSWNNTQALQLHCHVLSVPTNYEWQHPQITLHTICSFLENRGININNTSSWPCVSGKTVKHNDFLCSILHSTPSPALLPPPLFLAAPPSNFLQLLEVPIPM